MILKQLKQLTLSARGRNANLLRLPRLYSSPAVSQTLTTSKASKRLSRDDRRLVVESFVAEYRAANAGKFPSAKATVKEVGGGYYVVRDILQELKLRPNEPVSRVPASAANDYASSLKQDHTVESSHSSSDEVSIQGDNNLVITATHDRSETVTASLDKDVDSKCDGTPHLPESQTLKVAEECLKNSETKDEGTLTQLVSQEPKADHLEVVNVLPPTHDFGESETVPPPNNDVDSKCDGSTHLPENQTSMLSEECLKTAEIKEEGNLTLLGSQEPEADHIEGAADSVNVKPSETRQVPERVDGEVKTGETSSAWSNIISFAKGFANFWRKG